MEQHKPGLVFWESTKKCNLSCKHCRMENQNNPEELSTEEVKALIDTITKRYSPIFVFSGGEPLMREDIFDLAGYAQDKGLRTALASNGYLINQQTVERIVDTGIKRVSISLDSPDEAKHDELRNKVGAHYRAVKAINTLVKNDISTQINFTVTKKVSKQISEMVRYAIDLKVNALHCFLVVPVGCGVSLANDQILQKEEYEEALRSIYQAASLYEDDIYVKVTCGPQYYRILKENEPELFEKPQHPEHSLTRGCLAGAGVCFISAEGKVYPCGYLPVEAGNIRDEGFDQIWSESKVFSRLRDIGNLEGNCSNCEYTDICGGCRARAYAVTGDNYMAGDPDCMLSV